MPFEYSKLLGKIKERFGNQSKFAEAINLSERSLSLKLNGKRDWKQKEIRRVCDVLNIDMSQIHEYFFTPNVQRIEQTKSA